jgi:hypothetical protein
VIVHGSTSVSHKRLSVTIVFDSDELIRSPDDDPQGSKHVVIIKTTTSYAIVRP